MEAHSAPKMEPHSAPNMEAHSAPKMEAHSTQMEAHSTAKMEGHSGTPQEYNTNMKAKWPSTGIKFRNMAQLVHIWTQAGLSMQSCCEQVS